MSQDPHILIAYDRSQSSQFALKQGLELAKGLKAKITVLTVTEPLATYYTPYIAMSGEPMIDSPFLTAGPASNASQDSDPGTSFDQEIRNTTQNLKQRYNSQLEEDLQRIKKHCESEGLICQTLHKDGDARTKLCEMAASIPATILVIGSRGFGAVKRLLLGSVSTYVVHHAPCSVFVARPPKTEA